MDEGRESVPGIRASMMEGTKLIVGKGEIELGRAVKGLRGMS